MKTGLPGCVAAFVLVCAALPACAARHVTPSGPASAADPPGAPEERAVEAAGPHGSGPAEATRAPREPPASTLEATDPELAAALLQLAVFGGAAQHSAVGERYRQLGVLDAAHEHLTQAAVLDRGAATASDGLARIWRDWGFPHLALGHAHRAVYHAPGLPAVHNTLGTVLQALGHRAAARRAYDRALALEPVAGYALNNLCYLSFLEGLGEQAVGECRAALALEPTLTAARHNLALAYAAAGRLDLAERELMATDEAVGQYNIGVIALATGRYARAEEAFMAAGVLAPPLAAAARARARQARARMVGHPGKEQADARH